MQQTANRPAVEQWKLRLLGACVGYAALLGCARGVLHRIMCCAPEGGVWSSHGFVLGRAVNAMPIAAGHLSGGALEEEETFVSDVERLLEHGHPDATFIAAVRAKWSTEQHAAMLRDRRLLQCAHVSVEETRKRFEVKREADVAQHGLHPCSLPSCHKREATVKQFKYCGDCEAEWYCCAEHQVLDWKEHKPICRARAAGAAAAAALDELNI